MLSFKQFLFEAPSWEDHVKKIQSVVRNPEMFPVEFVDTDNLTPDEPGTRTAGMFFPGDSRILVATRGNDKTSPLYKHSLSSNSNLFTGELHPSVDDTVAHEAAHLVQKAKQTEKHGPFPGMKGEKGSYQQRQIERDARSAARSTRLMSTYNQRFADYLDQFPTLFSTQEGLEGIKKHLRSMDFASARKAERISGGPTTFRRANQTDKQTMAALYAAEQGLPQNLTDPEVRRRFIDQHRVKPPEVATPTKQATPSVPRRVSTQSAMSPILGAVAAASGAGAMGTAFNLATDVSGLLTLPPPKDRMEGEKAWNTDTGLAFDWIDGELVASPEGFKAVRQREKEGRSWPGPYAAR